MKKLILPVLFLVSLGLSSCSTTSPVKLYSWYGYDDAAYDYQKTSAPESRTRLLAEYEKMEQKQLETRQVVPPGFKAEYGYLLYKEGRTAEAIQKMKEEIAMYPESELYIGRIVKQLEK